MGIPSYYGTLITKIPHAIQRKAPEKVSALVVDMNCMIYHVLREPKMVANPYKGESERLNWERKLQDEVCTYLTHIWRSAGAPGQVYIALDGVVPYAKIKQQRFRRFKSAAANTKATETTWDTNAITPGTLFMKHMGEALKLAGTKHGWTISDTDEPGEGEHKVLRWLLSQKIVPGPVIVYGLDADLILLCLLAGDKLGAAYPILLLREAMAFGRLVRLKDSDEVDLGFFQVSVLMDILQRGGPWTRTQLYDYIFGMTFCGNDFLPTGLSLRIRDDGHTILLACLRDIWSSGLNLVTFNSDGIAEPNPKGLQMFAGWMIKQEERLIVTMVQRKMNGRLSENDDDNLPLIEQAEKPLINTVDDRIQLKPDWQTIYAHLALGESTTDQRKARVEDFWKGWCWVLDYYQGLPVDLEWVYPAGYPPTWRDLYSYFSVTKVNWIQREQLKPQEQLALVLPMSSWSLLLKTPYRSLPSLIPQYWPQGFALESFGKRFGWECEPMIPMLTPGRLRFEMRSDNPGMNP